MGFLVVLKKVFLQTAHRCCWFHKMDSVLNALPKSQKAS